MPKIHFIEHGGTEHLVDTESGLSVMESAVRNGIPGIDGDCGGVCACATCHVYIDPAWLGATGERTETETDMLELAADVEENSRLACQISMTDDLDGLIVRMPLSQF